LGHALRSSFFSALRIVSWIGFSAFLLRAQISVSTLPPAALIESSGSLTFTSQVLGALPGETTALTWSLNGVPQASTTNSITLGPAAGSAGAPLILTATSVFDSSKFSAVPLIPLNRSNLAQVSVPNAVAYHPGTGFVYAAVLVTNGANIDTKLVKIAPDGTQSTVVTLPSEPIYKLVPYSSNGTAYLLAIDVFDNQVVAVNLTTTTLAKPPRVVGGLNRPVSAAIDPVSGDLYIAEQGARRISVVSRSALDTALNTPNGIAPIGALPMTIPNISGVGFLADPASKQVSLLATSTSGTLYQINLANNSFSAVAGGLNTAEHLLVVQNSQLGFTFVLTGSSTGVDGQGQISALAPQGAGQPFLPAYALANGLDTVNDLAFVPPGTPYSTAGKWLILAASASPTASRDAIVRWEADPSVQGDFYAYEDRVQPSLSITSPAAGSLLTPGSTVQMQWSYNEGNPLNPPSDNFPEPAQIVVSTDGGNTFSPAGPSFIPSGPQGNQYSLSWQVPASTAGQTIQLGLQTTGLNGSPMQTTVGNLTVLPASAGYPQAVLVYPNFVLTGQNAKIAIAGLNFQSATTVGMGPGVTVSSAAPLSSSLLQVAVQAPASAATGAQSVLVCNPVACQQTPNAFFVLSASGPRITSVVPQSGSPGTTVVISGENFSGVAANNLVMFGHLTGIVSRATPASLTVQVPFGLNRGELPLSVQTNGVASNTAGFFLALSGFSAPMVNTAGVVNGASFAPGIAPVAPGSIVSLFGLNLFPTIFPTDAMPLSLPLPTQVLNTTVMIGGIPAPFFFAAPNQINVQVPEEMAGLNSVAVSLIYQGITGNTVEVSIAPQAPGIFSLASDGAAPWAVLNQDFSFNGPANPEHIGNTLEIYATGFGSANPPVPTGAAALSNPLSNSVPPRATIDGVPAAVTFAGRAPGFVGLDQVNVTIPAGVTTGKPVSMVLTAGGNAGPTVTVTVVP